LKLVANRHTALARGLGRWVSAAELGCPAPFVVYVGARVAVLGRLMPPPELTVSHGFPVWLRVKTVMVSLARNLRLVLWPTGQTRRHASSHERPNS
jgi:hypothetical protein